MTRLEKVKNGPRSVSQYKQYKQCPYSYYLQRVAGAWQRPAAWLVQGTAFHKAIEEYERNRGLSCDEVTGIYEAAFVEDANRLMGGTPNLDAWFASGPYKGEADLERRFKIGREQVLDYLDWRVDHPEVEIAIMPDGTPGIELEFDVEFGGVAVRGFIDQVLPGLVRDLKTGNQPGDDFQLAVYRLALLFAYDIDIERGDYWMGAKGGKHRGPTVPFDLDLLTEKYVTGEFQWLDEQIKAENFDPKPDIKACQFCSVRSSCEYRMGG